jgi:hypothetical protein
MVTLASFSDMLNEYVHYELLAEEMARQNFFIGKVEKDQNWRGGTLPVPFEGAKGSSVKFGGLTAEADITEYDYVRGEVSGYKECWGTMIWNAKDLVEHVPAAAREKGYINKQSFLRNIHGQLKTFIEDMKDTVSINLLNGSHFATLTADASANDGNLTVDRVERFKIGQKIVVDDDNSVAQTMWVKTINVNTKVVNAVTAKGGSTVFDFSAVPMTTAQNAKVYVDGAETSANVFTSLRSQLLSAANGGSANLFNVSKLAWPHLQAINVSGSAVSATNILEKIFDAWTTIKTLGKGNATDVICSYKHLGSVMKLLEAQAGGFRHVSTKATPFGYTEIEVFGVKGTLNIVGVLEMDDDVMYYMDWSALKLHSNGFFEKQVDPEGKAYYTTRSATDGYKYIVDIRFFGELVLHTPCHCGVMYGITAY